MTRVTFPPDFVWGAATSSFQIEGATREEGRGESIWDRFAATPGTVEDGSNGDVACDHYHRWPEDVALMKRLGLAAYRFSIAWPRVIPAGRGAVNARGLDFYSRLVDGLLENGITPFVTLFHWDLPQALQDEGGWAVRSTAEAFAHYVDVVARRLGDRVKHWITHNEPWCSGMLSHQVGRHAPGLKDWRLALAASHHLLLSHGLAVAVVRAARKDAEVGITLNLSPAVAASPSDADRDACRHFDGYMNRWFLDPVFGRGYPKDMLADYAAAGHIPRDGVPECLVGDLDIIAAKTDFLGVNYYNRTILRSDRVGEKDNLPRSVFLAPESEWTTMGWEVYPDGLRQTLERVHADYRPARIFITENGASYADVSNGDGIVHDPQRLRFVRDHLLSARRAMEAGVPLAGYFVWSLLDNFEWDRGYTKRFGITYVDYATQRRTFKDSALWYRKVIAEKGVESPD